MASSYVLTFQPQGAFPRNAIKNPACFPISGKVFLFCLAAQVKFEVCSEENDYHIVVVTGHLGTMLWPPLASIEYSISLYNTVD
jgi:hypothetical protein